MMTKPRRATMNRGFPGGKHPEPAEYDRAIDGSPTVWCGACQAVVAGGTAHIVLSPYGPDMHVLYCPSCCPADHDR